LGYEKLEEELKKLGFSVIVSCQMV
jgi:hypothetical protein